MGFPTTKAVNNSYINMALLNNVKMCRLMVDVKNDYFDNDGLENVVGEVIIEHNEDEDGDRHSIDIAK